MEGAWVKPVYQYSAVVVRWVDGDTVDVSLDLGFDVVVNTRLRLFGVDTPERSKLGQRESAVLAWQRAQQLAPVGSQVVATTLKGKEKFGRYLAVVHLAEGDVAGVLIAEGLGRSYFGGAKESS